MCVCFAIYHTQGAGGAGGGGDVGWLALVLLPMTARKLALYNHPCKTES